MLELFPLYHQCPFWPSHLSDDQVILPSGTTHEHMDSELHSVGPHLEIYAETRAQFYLTVLAEL